jgi:hypothetical protein
MFVVSPSRSPASTSAWLTHLRTFSAEREYFETLRAHSTVKVAELLMGTKVDIEALAIRRFCL